MAGFLRGELPSCDTTVSTIILVWERRKEVELTLVEIILLAALLLSWLALWLTAHLLLALALLVVAGAAAAVHGFLDEVHCEVRCSERFAFVVEVVVTWRRGSCHLL